MPRRRSISGRYLDKALAIAPEQPLLLSLKAYCYATRALYGTIPRQDLERAAAIVERTRVVEERPWESWFAQACVQMALHWDWRGARGSFDRAITLSGGNAQYQPWYTAFLASQGEAAKAAALLRVSVSRVHDSPIVRADLAANQVFAGQYDEAEETITTACALFGPRTHYLLFVHLAILREARGDGQGALDALAQVPLKWPRTSITLGLRALFSGLAGDRRTARRHFVKLRALRLIAGPFVPAIQLCVAAIGAGEVPTALNWLRQSAEVERDPNLILSNVYPFFRHLHHEPGFKDIVVNTMHLALPESSAR
jgi:Tfp pilus assembly protein PilF